MDDDERDGHNGAGALRGDDSVEAEAIRAEGLDPDDPAVRGCARPCALGAGTIQAVTVTVPSNPIAAP